MSALGVARTAAEAVEAMAARDPLLPELSLVLDAAGRRALLGHESVVERVRYKPGTSVVVSVRDDDGERHWIHSTADPVKLEKTAMRARRTGAGFARPTRRTMTGPVRADRMLSPVLAAARRAAPAMLDGARLLRYNPHRRLVLRTDSQAIKVAARPSGLGDEVARRLSASGAPVLAPDPITRHATATQWWGVADLAADADPRRERLAGAAIAAVHASDLSSLAPLPVVDPAARAAEAVSAIDTVLPELTERTSALAARLADALGATRPTVLVHGDFSPDQVLCDGDRVRLIDFDHAALSTPERDLGSALASGASAALLEGYRAAGGTFEPLALELWRSLALLQRAIEPFRSSASEWPSAIEARVSAAEEALP